MANLKSIKSKIISYKKTGTVTHAMEAVSAVKMRKSQERAISSRPYARAGLRVLAGVSRHHRSGDRPLSQGKTSRGARRVYEFPVHLRTAACSAQSAPAFAQGG